MSKRINSPTSSRFAARDDVPTIAEALEKWEAQTDVPTGKKRRVRLDVLKMCDWFDMRPEALLAHPADLNPRFRKLKTGKISASMGRKQNVRNSAKTLLRHVTYGNGRSFKPDLMPAWAEQDRLIPDKYRRTSVMCLMQFASAQLVAPEAFDDAASAALLTALIDDRLNGNPKITHQNAVRASNVLRDMGIGWIVPRLTPPRYVEVRIKKWSDLPAWCGALVRAIVERSTTNDPYDLSKPFKAWSAATKDTYETQLRRFFSAAETYYLDFQCPRTWRDVATYAFAEPVLRSFTDRHGGKKGWVLVAGIASLLGQIALNPEGKPKLSPEEQTAHKAVAAELVELSARLKSNKGLSQAVLARVSPFKDEANLAKLFLLPFALERSLLRSRLGRRATALLAQWAVALMILTFCPLRISTLARLEDRHLKWSRPGRRGELSLELEADMLKGAEQASVPMPPDCARLIKMYIEKYRPLLVRHETTHLFPGKKPGVGKDAHTLSTQLRMLIEDRTGLPVNPHLYRHLVHIVILRRFPGAYVMISRVLTHKSLETAVRNYAYFDAEMSMAAYQQLVREVQTGTRSKKLASPQSLANSHMEQEYASRKSPR